jgi:hypothetical protein
MIKTASMNLNLLFIVLKGLPVKSARRMRASNYHEALLRSFNHFGFCKENPPFACTTQQMGRLPVFDSHCSPTTLV